MHFHRLALTAHKVPFRFRKSSRVPGALCFGVILIAMEISFFFLCLKEKDAEYTTHC